MRISRDQMFMEMARTASKRSTCHRLNVGCILVHDKNVVSHGYNGPLSGEPHCRGNSCQLNESGGCMRSVHAEKNALNRMSDEFMDVPVILYVTHSPCPDCCEFIRTWNGNISCIIYETAYRDTTALDELAKKLTVFRLTPSGYLMNHHTKEVCNSQEQDQ